MRQLQIASVFAVSALLALPAAAGTPSREVSKTLPLGAGEHVRVDTYKGSVKVTTWDKAEVAVEARVVADDSCGSTERQARWVDQTKVVIETGRPGVAITSDYDALDEWATWFGSCTSRPFVHYVIRMPKSAPLRIKDYKSDLDVKELAADPRVDTYKGTVDVVGLAGALEARDVQGRGEGEHRPPRRRRARRDVQGLDRPHTCRRPAAFELSAERAAGATSLGVPAREGTTAVARRGLDACSGAVNGGGPRVSLTTDKGSLAVRKG